MQGDKKQVVKGETKIHTVDEAITEKLKKIGMCEYESKIFSLLITLRVASAREIHEITAIPRSRVYDTLSTLAKKGYVTASGDKPTCYSPTDITKRLEQCKLDRIAEITDLSNLLSDLETQNSGNLFDAYELKTEWAIMKHIRMILNRAKDEVILLTESPEMVSLLSSDLTKTYRRVHTYVIVGENTASEMKMPIKYYLGTKELNKRLIEKSFGKYGEKKLKLILYVDKRDVLFVVNDSENIMGVYIIDDIQAEFISDMILKNIHLP